MKILAIETSCDETAIAVLRACQNKNKPDFELLSNIVASQIKIHQKYGGVYPAMAKREHERNLVPVLKQSLLAARLLKSKTKNKKPKTNIKNEKIKTLKEILNRHPELYKNLKKFLNKYEKPLHQSLQDDAGQAKIDIIAVTNGPGLEPCLWTGINFAKALAFYWDLPIIPINHMEAHILANLLPQISPNPKHETRNPKQIQFPAVCLVVSGGHTQLVLMKDFGKYKIIGETRDDAAGECYDKTARILGLPYPGGPAIAEQARQFKSEIRSTKFEKINLPRPMIYSKDYDFSFSGLKTAVLYDFKKRNLRLRQGYGGQAKKYIQTMSFEIQQAINDVLIKKTIKAAKDFRVKTIILGGGVAANDELRKQLNYKLQTINYKLNFLVPSKKFCTDNAAMIAITAYFNQSQKTKSWAKIQAQANLRL